MTFGVHGANAPDERQALDKIVDFYGLRDLDQETLDEAKVHAFVDACSDSMFSYGIDVTAKTMAENHPASTWFYYLTYECEHTLANFRTDHSVAPPPSKAMR